MRFFFLFFTQFCLFFALFLVIPNHCLAQLRNVYIVPQNSRLKLNYEGDFSPQYAIPLGLSQSINPYNAKAAGALNGWGLECRLQHRIRKNALWAVGLSLGWLQNDYNQEKLNQFISQQASNSTSLIRQAKGDSWQRLYFVPHIAFRAGIKRKIELTVGLGLGQSSGGFSQKTYLNLEKTLLLRQTWAYQNPITAVVKISLLWGQTFGKHRQWLLFVQSGIIHTAGNRKAVLSETRQRWDDINQSAAEEVFNGQFNVLQAFRFSSWQLGCGLRYHFYKTLYPHTRSKDGIIYH